MNILALLSELDNADNRIFEIHLRNIFKYMKYCFVKKFLSKISRL